MGLWMMIVQLFTLIVLVVYSIGSPLISCVLATPVVKNIAPFNDADSCLLATLSVKKIFWYLLHGNIQQFAEPLDFLSGNLRPTS